MDAVSSNSPSSNLLKIANKLDNFIEFIGRSIAWFSFAMVILMFAIVLLRYGFSLGWIALQESVLYLHAYLFMLGCSYALKHDEHVRVDVFYRRFSPFKKALVNVLGHLILLWPVAIFILLVSFDYVSVSWQIKEQSQEAGGLPFVYLLKSLIPAMSILLLIQSVSEICKSLNVLLKKGAV